MLRLADFLAWCFAFPKTACIKKPVVAFVKHEWRLWARCKNSFEMLLLVHRHKLVEKRRKHLALVWANFVRGCDWSPTVVCLLIRCARVYFALTFTWLCMAWHNTMANKLEQQQRPIYLNFSICSSLRTHIRHCPSHNRPGCSQFSVSKRAQMGP